MKTQHLTLVVFSLQALCWTPVNSANAQDGIRVTKGLVTLIDDIEISAEAAGTLASLDVQEGDRVAKGHVLGKINDQQAVSAKALAAAELAAAEDQAASNADLVIAQAAFETANAQYDRAVATNRRSPGAIPADEFGRLKLEREKARHQVDRARLDRVLLGHTLSAKLEEFRIADQEVARRTIPAPIDGVVVEVWHHAGEWVNPGDAVLRVVRLDRLCVKAYLKEAVRDPASFQLGEVAARLTLRDGRSLQTDAKVVFISPLTNVGGEYAVWIKVANRQETGKWLLRPGQLVDMEITPKL